MGEDDDEGERLALQRHEGSEAHRHVFPVALAHAGAFADTLEEDDDGVFLGGFVVQGDEHAILAHVVAARQGLEHESLVIVLPHEFQGTVGGAIAADERRKHLR